MQRFAALMCGVAVSVTLAGCSGGKGAPAAAPGGSGSTVSYSGGAIAQTNDAKVVVDGQPHKIDGGMACTRYDKAPTAKKVILGGIVGFNLFVDPPGHGDAKVTKDGKNYTVAGNAWGLNYTLPDPVEVTKPFEIQLSCP